MWYMVKLSLEDMFYGLFYNGGNIDNFGWNPIDKIIHW